jgi:glycosyltransferase involved in cell wall biosynthesis
MRISIAMATYNGERFIREQLDSLARQTYLPCELVVSDDGSTDHTLGIVEDFAKLSPFPVRIYRNQRNVGYADNFLKAASLCEGDWVAFCDQDDVWLEHKLEIICKFLENSSEIFLITHSAALVDEQLAPLGALFPNHRTTKIVERLRGRFWYTLYGFTAIFRRILVTEIPWQDRPRDFTGPCKKQSHDLWVYFLASILGQVVFLSDVLALYRRHGSTVTATNVGSKIGRIDAVIRTGHSHYQLLAEIAQEYESLLRDLFNDSRISFDFRKRFCDGASFMRILALQMNNRVKIHHPDSKFSVRAQALFENLKLQSYCSRSGDIRIRTVIKDAAQLVNFC